MGIFSKSTLIFWHLKKHYNHWLKFKRLSKTKQSELLKKKFSKKLGRQLNLSNPVYFSDKIQWLKLFYQNPLLNQCVDKYAVRQFVKDQVGDEILNEAYAIYDQASQVDFEKLPSSFVLKATHGYGWNIICANKGQLNQKKARKKLIIWEQMNHFYQGLEWAYKDIKPRIICERFLQDPERDDLLDYKFFCFNGQPHFIQVDIDRSQSHTRNIYTIDWQLLDISLCYPTNHETKIGKPNQLDKMVEIAKKLSKSFPFVRVDLFLIQGRVYFGELTFYPESGWGQFSDIQVEKEWGDLLQLPTQVNNNRILD